MCHVARCTLEPAWIDCRPGIATDPSIGDARNPHDDVSESLPDVARVIAIANQKGGVGKTTTAVNLAASLAAAEQQTLLIDGDPQGNATSGVGVQKDQIKSTVYEVLLGDVNIADATIPQILFKHLDVVPATPDLAGAEVELVNRGNRERLMRAAVDQIRDAYDYVLIDCPPSLGLITLNMIA